MPWAGSLGATISVTNSRIIEAVAEFAKANKIEKKQVLVRYLGSEQSKTAGKSFSVLHRQNRRRHRPHRPAVTHNGQPGAYPGKGNNMEERKNMSMNIDDIDKLAIACINSVCIAHTLMREIADEGENAEHAREHIKDIIKKGTEASGMLFGIALAIKEGHFEKRVIVSLNDAKTESDKDEAEDTGKHEPFKLDD